MMTVESFEENLKQNNEKCDVLIQEILSTAGNLKLHELLYRYLLHKFMLFDLLEELSEHDRKNTSADGTTSMDRSTISTGVTVTDNYFNPEREDCIGGKTEDILELAQQSVEIIAHLQKGGLKFKDHSGTCGSVSSAVTKKILFLIALQKALGITFEKHEAADIETVSDLTEHVKEHLFAKWQAGVPDARTDMERGNDADNTSHAEKRNCNVETCEKKVIFPQKKSELALRQNRLVDEINHLGDSLEQYSYLVYRSGQMPALPEQYKTETNRVKGCQSVVWMVLSVEDGIMHFKADSDTLLMKGVLAVLQDLVDGVAAEDVCQTSIDIFDRTQLAVSFQSDRLAGIQSILNNIQKTACGAVRH